MSRQYPKRTESHKIGEQAVFIMKEKLGDNFIVHQQSEGDYGIDATVEIFNDEIPSGCVFFAQVKGVRGKYNSTVKKSDFENREYIIIDFPVKTLNYANLFSVPFFLFYTSIELKKTKFVWLQKYYEIEVENKNIDISNKEKVRIKIPVENDLDECKDKIIRIVSSENKKNINLKFIVFYNRFMKMFKQGNASHCISLINKIKKQNVIIQTSDDLIKKNMSVEYMMGIDYDKSIKLLNKISNRLPLNKEDERDKDNLMLSLMYHSEKVLNEDLCDILNEWIGHMPY